MSSIFSFGEKIDKYDYKVINEREARASAGIMFLLGLLSLFSVFTLKTMFWAELFSITFIIEFIIRNFINPKYAPYMLIASFIVANQEPEWVEAKPKRFAWFLGLLLGIWMAYYVVTNVYDLTRLLICVACLILLYLEAVFGICLGCIIYKKLNIKVQNCPGGVCEVKEKRDFGLKRRLAFLVVNIAIFYALFYYLNNIKYDHYFDHLFMTQEEIDNAEFENEDFDDEESEKTPAKSSQKDAKTDKNCTPPQWAIDMGHKDMWLEHNGCK